MTIEIKEKGTREFYTETINVASQYKGLIKKPDRKIIDLKKNQRDMAILYTVLGIIWFCLSLSQGFSLWKTVFVIALFILAVTSAFIMHNMKSQADKMLAYDRPAIITLDEDGVELKREHSNIMRLSWDNVAFVRSFKESTSFFAKDASGIVISVTNKYKDQIMEYLNTNDIGIQIVNMEKAG